MTSSKKACLVIGAGDDTGAAIGRAFAREGMVSCLVRRPRHADALEALAQSIRDDGLLAQAMPLIIVAIGQMIVIVLAGMDLSVGSVMSMTTAILALDGSPLVLIPLVFAAAAGVGLVNGVAIVKLNVHPIIATLSMQFIVLGIAQ